MAPRIRSSSGPPAFTAPPPLLLLLLVYLCLWLSPYCWAFHYYLAEEKYCHLALESGVRIMSKPIQPSQLSNPVLVTRISDGSSIQPGETFVPGEVLTVAFNASALEDEGSRRRLTWVAEASLPSSLFHSEADPELDAALAENSRVRCEARAVARAVPAIGDNHVLWRMPDAAEEGEDVWVALAYAWRYGTVHVTDRVVLRAPEGATPGEGKSSSRGEEL